MVVPPLATHHATLTGSTHGNGEIPSQIPDQVPTGGPNAAPLDLFPQVRTPPSLYQLIVQFIFQRKTLKF